jgi:hypothetical protein
MFTIPEEVANPLEELSNFNRHGRLSFNDDTDDRPTCVLARSNNITTSSCWLWHVTEFEPSDDMS